MTLFCESLIENPIIASITDLDNLQLALDSPSRIIFLSAGNIFNLKEISQRVKSMDKKLFISIDSIDGFSKDTWGLEYIVKNIELDGIITKKPNLVKLGKDMGVYTIEKMVIHDSNTLNESLQSIRKLRPHAVDISPGIMTRIISRIAQDTKIHIIASGLISDKNDMQKALNAGAIGISSSNYKTWYLNY